MSQTWQWCPIQQQLKSFLEEISAKFVWNSCHTKTQKTDWHFHTKIWTRSTKALDSKFIIAQVVMIQKYHFWFENLLFFFLLQPKLVIFLLEWINDQCNFYFTRFVKWSFFLKRFQIFKLYFVSVIWTFNFYFCIIIESMTCSYQSVYLTDFTSLKHSFSQIVYTN